MEQLIKEHLSSFNMDVRKSGDARFMDQKCTPDVISIMADCVLNLVGDDKSRTFTVNDIWSSQYFIKTVKMIFKKPSADNHTVIHEYDKFIQQPLRMLAYANVLGMVKCGRVNLYCINKYDILEFISLSERNASRFLYKYIERVLIDSGIYHYFEDYKNAYLDNKLDDKSFNSLKEKFQRFIVGHTKINGIVEVNRIFPKVLNVYAFHNGLLGTIKGRLSKHEIYYDDLMYNRRNWRDIGKKEKNTSRQEAKAQCSLDLEPDDTLYKEYLVQRAINQIKRLYAESEIKDQWNVGEATQVHHIFPRYEFPQLAHRLENLIKLTPTQHYTKAHPRNKTKDINVAYQLTCLLAKSHSIEKSLRRNEPYYRKESFLYCVNTGLSLELKFDITFGELKMKLAVLYNKI